MKWSDLPRLASASFTWENSGAKAQEAPPYSIEDNGKLSTYTKWIKPIGWTRDPPFAAGFVEKTIGDAPSVSIMYEWPDGRRLWFHHLLIEEIDDEPIPDELEQPPEMILE